jgi:hypothetical protein
MADYKFIGDEAPDGLKIGNASTSKVGFYGATPVVRQTAAGALTGASDSTAIAAAVNAISLTLSNLGIAA